MAHEGGRIMVNDGAYKGANKGIGQGSAKEEDKGHEG